MRILLTGGGTGGHLSPLVAVVREIKKISQERGMPMPEFIYLGPNSFSREFLESEGVKIKIILAGKLRRYFSLKVILDAFKLPIGLIQTMWYLFIYMPDVVFSKGGYGSVPVVLVSRLYRIPVVLHESDTIPGLANRLLSKFATKIGVSFSGTEKFFPAKKTALIGNPIRNQITQKASEQAKAIFNLVGDKPVIFIFGGSQGAMPINEIILATLPQLLEKYELIWQTGEANYETINKEVQEIIGSLPTNCHLLPFLNEEQVGSAYAASNLVISRAGASNIFEIAACGKPSIIIPLPNSASEHQRENAFEYARSGAAIVLEQTNLTPHILINEISRIIKNPELLDKISACAKSFAKPDAAKKIAEELINLATS